MKKNNLALVFLISSLGILFCFGCFVFFTMEDRNFINAMQNLLDNPTIETAKMNFTGHSETFTKFDFDLLRFHGLKNIPENVSTQDHHVLYVTWTGIPQQRIFLFYEPEHSNVVAIGQAKW